MNIMNGGGAGGSNSGGTTISSTNRGGGINIAHNNNINGNGGVGGAGGVVGGGTTTTVSVSDAVLVESNNSMDDSMDHYSIVQDHSQKTSSCVWKYFGSLKKNDELIDLKHVYCIKCFDQSKTKKYQKSTSTGNLIKHLKKTHNITDQPSYRIKQQKNRIIVTKEESGFHYPDDGGESDYFLENMPNSGYITLPVNTSGGASNHQNNSNDIDQIHNHTNRITAKIEQNDGDHEYLVHDINEVLINEVAKRPAIFDASLCTKNKVQIRRDLWMEIYESLNHIIPLDKLPKIWKNIRDRYQKIKKDMDKDRRNVKPKYRYFEMLRFLDDVDVNMVGHDPNTTILEDYNTSPTNCGPDGVTVTTTDDKNNVPVENFVSIYLNDHQSQQDDNDITHLDPVTMQELVAVKEEIFHHDTKRKKIKLDIDDNVDHNDEHDENQQILHHSHQQQQHHELNHHQNHENNENHHHSHHHHHHHHQQYHDAHEEILMASDNTKVTIHLLPSDSDDQEHNQENQNSHNHHHHHDHNLDQHDEEEDQEEDDDVEHLHPESSTPTPQSPPPPPLPPTLQHQHSSLSSPTTHNQHHHHHSQHLRQNHQQQQQHHQHQHHHHHQQSNILPLSVGIVHQSYNQSTLKNSTMELSSPVHNTNNNHNNGDSMVNLAQPQSASSSSSSSSSSQSLSWQSTPMINLSLSSTLPKLKAQPPSTMALITANSSSSSLSSAASLSPTDIIALQTPTSSSSSSPPSSNLVHQTPIKHKSNNTIIASEIVAAVAAPASAIATTTAAANNNTITIQKTSEEFTIFCSYVAEVMRNMDKQKARLLQMKVMQLITEYDTN